MSTHNPPLDYRPPQFVRQQVATQEHLSSYNFPFTLQQLVVLKAYAVSQSLEEAAATLGMSKSNVSLTLKNMERTLGLELLLSQGTKGARGELSAAGHLLLRYTERLLALAADAMRATRDLQEVRTGSIYVAASQTTGVYLMPRLIERYKRQHPEVLVHLQVENTRRCCAAVARGEVNIGLVGGDIPRELEHLLQVRPYQEDEVVIIVGRDHPLAGCEEVDREALANLKFVSLHRSSTLQGIKASLEQHGIDWKTLQTVMEVNSVEAIKSSVEANLGVAFVSAVAIEKEVELGRLHAVRIRGVPLSRTLLCVTDPARYCSKAARALIRELFGLNIELAPQGCFLPSPRAAQSPNLPAHIIPTLYEGRYPGLAGRHDFLGSADSVQPALESEDLLPNHAQTAADKIPFTLGQLVVFRTVALTGSGAAAAITLSVSQPAISKSLALLEQAFGGPLVVRRTGGGPTRLTEAGQALLPFCASLLAVAGEAVRALADLRAAHTGRVALAASQTVGTYVVPRLLAAFRTRNPGVTVTLQVDQSRRACDAVARGEADCAIIGGDVPEDLEAILQVTPYAHDELVLIVPRHHELAKRGSIALEQLYTLPLVSLNQGSSVQLGQEKLLRQHGILWRHLKIDMEFNSVEAIKSAVQYGLGAAFVSSAAIVKEMELGLFRRLDISGVRLVRILSLVSSPTREPSFAAQKFMSDMFATPGPRACNGSSNGGSNGNGCTPSPVLFRNAVPAPRPWEQRVHRSPSDLPSHHEIIPLLEDESGPEKK
ncbi:probable ruBisCO transcriptional regulator [Coccomyxa sp. Obi]|nr:probable ruBisCO transcriptional regulator [Coccomyxa sp. Obi]